MSTSPNPGPTSPPPSWTPGSVTPDARRRGRGVVLAAVGAVALIVVGGVVTTMLVIDHRDRVAAQERADASASSASAASEAAASESSASVAAEEQAEADALAAAQDTLRQCRRQIGPFQDALETVDARLDVGLTQAQLSDLVGDASVAYNRIDIDALGTGNCLSAAAKLEGAFNAYAGSVSTWDDCIFDYGCDVDGIDPQLQTAWLKSSRLLERADRLLDQMDPLHPDYVEGAAGDVGA